VLVGVSTFGLGILTAWCGLGIAVSLMRGPSSLALIPRVAYVIPEVPDGLDEDERRDASVVLAFSVLAGLFIGGALGIRAWRRIVVGSFGWTDEQVKAFMKRGPDA